MSGSLKLLLAALAGGILIYYGVARDGAPQPTRQEQARRPPATAEAAQTWGNPASLPDHYARHGADFGARSAEDYARMAAQFLQHAKAQGFPAKVDARGDLRVFDPRSGSFAAYNPDGTTKTFFKPQSRGYFDRQPGRIVDLRTWR